MPGRRPIELNHMFDDFHDLCKNHKQGNNISAAGAFLKNKYTQSHVFYQNLVFDENIKTIQKGRRPSSVVRRSSSVVRRPSSVVRRPSSVVRRRRPPMSSVARRPSPSVLRQRPATWEGLL